jgi:hypothetical protein
MQMISSVEGVLVHVVVVLVGAAGGAVGKKGSEFSFCNFAAPFAVALLFLSPIVCFKHRSTLL